MKQENFINKDEYIADLKQTIEDLNMQIKNMSDNTNRQDFTGRMRARARAPSDAQSNANTPVLHSSPRYSPDSDQPTPNLNKSRATPILSNRVAKSPNMTYSGNAPNNSNNISSPNKSNNNIPNQVNPDYNNSDLGSGNSGIVRGGRGRFIVDAEKDTIMPKRAGLIFNGQIGKPGFNFIITDAELTELGSMPSSDSYYASSVENGPCKYYKGVMYGEIIPSNDPKYQMSGPTVSYGLTVHQLGLCPTNQESLNCEKISNWPNSLAQCKLARRKGDPNTLYFFCFFSKIPEDTYEIFKYDDTDIVDRGDLGKVILPGTTTQSGYTVKWETTDGNNADIGSTIKIF